MDQRDQLTELIRVQAGILVDCFKIVKDIEFLSTQNQPSEIARVLEGDPFFIRAGNYMWAILVLELNKLYDNKEDYSLDKTLNVSFNNRKRLPWKNPQNIDVLSKLKEELNASNTQGYAKNIKHIRSKIYAHLDKNRLEKEVLIHISEAKQLLDLAQRIVSETNFALEGGRLGLDYDPLGLCEGSVRNLAAYNAIRE